MSDDLRWRRMPGFALIYFMGQFGSQLLNQIPLIAASLVAVVSFDSLPLPHVAIMLLLLVVLSGLASYLSFSYIQQRDRFLVRRGIFSRERIELPFARIQNINIKQPIYYRPFNLVILGLDTAGSAGKEIEIAALSYGDAERIKETILHWRAESPVRLEGESVAPGGEPLEKGNLLVRRSVKDIVLHGFTNNRAWLLLAVVAPFLQRLEQQLAEALGALDVNVQGWLAGQDALSLSVLATVLLIALFAIFSTISIVGALLTMFGYRLYFDCDTYIRKSGLFNRYEIRVQKRRVQTVQWAQTWMDTLFARANVLLEPFAVNGNESRRYFMQKIMVPSLTYREAKALIEYQCAGLDWQGLVFQRIHPLYILHKMVFSALPLACLAAVWMRGNWYLGFIVGVGVVLVCALLIFVRWLRYGVAVAEGYVFLRSGFIGQKIFCVPTFKAQQLSFIQSVFQRRRALADLKLVTASRTVVLPYMSADLAERLLDEVLADVEFSGESWM